MLRHGDVIRKYFRNNFDIIDKEDLSLVTIADRVVEESIVSIILDSFPIMQCESILEENGWRCKERTTEYVWVLDHIDETKSFITGKPLFGTLIALLHKGKPVAIDSKSVSCVINGAFSLSVSTRHGASLGQAYLCSEQWHMHSVMLVSMLNGDDVLAWHDAGKVL
ncbi:hypothetical protein Sjap_022515 [Stephania japonica]|uniref:Uncharacterized protein n=1 Tax=Stephania japonica TaxID=461633 RepID=A0AAP0HPY1_9MAGN